MLALLLGIGAVAGLTFRAISRSTGPSRTKVEELDKLEHLKMRRALTLDEAEDGRVLARRFRDAVAYKRFTADVIRLKTKRVPV